MHTKHLTVLPWKSSPVDILPQQLSAEQYTNALLIQVPDEFNQPVSLYEAIIRIYQQLPGLEVGPSLFLSPLTPVFGLNEVADEHQGNTFLNIFSFKRCELTPCEFTYL